MRPSLLSISYRFPPETYPLAMRVEYVLSQLRNRWDINAITAAENPQLEGATIHHVRPREAEGAIGILRRLRLGKFVDLFFWPDLFALWILPALYRAWSVSRRTNPAAILTFCMPYSTGIVGVLLKKWTGIPLILNLNDSPTCTDMNASYPTRLHYRLALWLEDWFVRNADAVIYVSRRNMERVRNRQPISQHAKFHLIRRGVRPLPAPEAPKVGRDTFRILYTGDMSGWHFGMPPEDATPSLLQRVFRKWKEWGRFYTTELDPSSHSPLYIGNAIKEVVDAHPEWRGKISLEIYGSTFPQEIVDTMLKSHDLESIVTVNGPVPHEEVLQRIQNADLLFMTLPRRVDDSPGGRISAKTYEYLMTDRPILAALPPGENSEYLRNKPGVFLTAPRSSDEMAAVISKLAAEHFSGTSKKIDRTSLQSELLSTSRARAFEEIVDNVVGHRETEPSTVRASATEPAGRSFSPLSSRAE